mgnify:CR=1 FL=1
MSTFTGYGAAHKDTMRIYCASLPEDHRRCYAALKIVRSGITFVTSVSKMSRRTLYTGIWELEAMDTGDGGSPSRSSVGPQRVRRRGGGRPKATARQPGLQSTCERILETNSVGSPTNPDVVWTHFKSMQLATALVRCGFDIGRNIAARLLEGAGYQRRALRKELITGHVDLLARDCQFYQINDLRRQAHAAGNPVLCVDMKKKALLGYLHRPGQCYGTGIQRAYDHDFRHLAEGHRVPQGAYDAFNHHGFITLGTSRATSAFVCDAVAPAWNETFWHNGPRATEIVLTFDAGGANAVRSLSLEEDLIALSRRLGLPVCIAHDPPYTSKWHPIEHCLFSQFERGLRGVMLDSPPTALNAIQRVSTQTGLSAVATILNRVYEIGRKCCDGFHEAKDLFIHHDAVLRQRNSLVYGRRLNP